MTVMPVFNAFGQLLYFIDAREIVHYNMRAPVTVPRPDAHEPVGGVLHSPPAADRQPYYEAGWWAA